MLFVFPKDLNRSGYHIARQTFPRNIGTNYATADSFTRDNVFDSGPSRWHRSRELRMLGDVLIDTMETRLKIKWDSICYYKSYQFGMQFKIRIIK